MQAHPPNVRSLPQLRSPRSNRFTISLGLVLLVLAVFGQTIRFGFVNYDDDSRVYANLLVQQGVTWKGIATYFSLHHPRPDYWHPLTFLTHMVDCQFYGLWAGGHHLTNVLLHAAVTVLLFLFLRSMTGAVWRSAFVAALFAIHPLRVESVAWISERKDMLSGIFFLLTLGAYLRYGRDPSVLRYLGVAALFALGLMSKPTLMPLPLLLLALDFWPLDRFHQVADKPHRGGTFLRLFLEKIPLLAMSLFSCIEASLANAPAFSSAASIPFWLRQENVPVSYLRYLLLAIWPSGLCNYYPFPASIPVWQSASSLFILVVISLLLWKIRRRFPILLLGWFWYLVMLLPMIGIVQAGGITHADRYTYVPMIGIAVVAVWGTSALLRRGGFPRWIATGVPLLLLLPYAGATLQILPSWHDSSTLWTRALAVAPENDLAHNSLGNALMEQGMEEQAMREFRRAILLNPDSCDAHLSLGFLLFRMGRDGEAEAELRRALAINSHNPVAWNDLGNVLCREGREPEGEAAYRESIRIDPSYCAPRYNLGELFFHEGNEGNREEGVAQIRQALTLDTRNAKWHSKLGGMLRQMGRSEEALQEYRAALKLDEKLDEALTGCAGLLGASGRRTEAIAMMRKAYELHPGDAPLCNDLAWMLATAPESNLRDGRRALELARKVIETAGDHDPNTLDTLAAAYAETGDFPKALETARRALDLAGAAGNTGLAESLRKEILLYESGKPLRDPSP